MHTSKDQHNHMSVTCDFNGRLGNILYNMSHVIAHCKRHDLQWFFPTHAWACINQVVPISVPNTGTLPFQPMVYHEPVDGEGHPYYHDIPVRDNVLFRGYYQSFLYFDQYRQQILDVLYSGSLSWFHEPGIVALHVRMGDCISQPDGFPMAPMGYYRAAISYMQQRGYSRFRVYSDDIAWCVAEFHNRNYDNAEFDFSQDPSEVVDFCSISGCEHQITARSTFSLMAAWMNRNPNKIVLCPSIEQHYWWRGQNRDLLTGTEHWLKQITW